jgi:hypothetical protein
VSGSSENQNSFIDPALEKIGGFVRQLQVHDPNITDEEGVAIVQHYSAELGIGTWLIDFSWDPFVALFFASYGGEDGDIGIISYIGLGEFKRFSADGKNRLGTIKYIVPKGVPRINAQQALFIDTSHPDLYEQFVPHTIYLKQKKGLYFEDPTRIPTVTKSALYPENDPFLKEIQKMKKLQTLKNEPPLTFQPMSDDCQPLSPQEYEKIVYSWNILKPEQLSDSSLKVVQQLCKVYTNFQ